MPKELDDRVFGKENAAFYKKEIEKLRKSLEDDTFNEEQAKEDYENDMLKMFGRDVFDVLNLTADEAIAPLSPVEYIKKFKGSVEVTATFDGQEGSMFRYQETYMDEKDLAEHKFREQTSTEKSLKDFSQEDY